VPQEQDGIGSDLSNSEGTRPGSEKQQPGFRRPDCVRKTIPNLGKGPTRLTAPRFWPAGRAEELWFISDASD
jgi:hypothetical protein